MYTTSDGVAHIHAINSDITSGEHVATSASTIVYRMIGRVTRGKAW
jgi:hypothetical protein